MARVERRNNMNKKSRKIPAVIVAAGKGVRYGKGSKMFADLKGHSLLYYSLQTMAATPEVGTVVVVTSAERMPEARQLIEQGGFRKVSDVVRGGSWRGQSVLRGLEALPQDSNWVIVHDAARPMTSPGIVKRIIRARGRNDALTMAVPVTDTVMRAGRQMSVEGVVPREGLYAIQTPQLLRYPMLLKYYRKAAKTNARFSDDVGLFLKYGGRVKLVEGERSNIKVTYRDDLAMVEGLLNK
jgi:2-C-methyl-D-erythritol 4-phosphate cytidylyltransferase